MNDLTQSDVLAVLDYDPSTGIFTGRDGDRKNRPAGSRHSKGYRQIRLPGGHRHLAHRLAWLCVYGHWPKNIIDHINGVKDDNRIENLREATNSQNAANARKRYNSASGLKGVTFVKRENAYIARIRVNGQERHLGYFKNPNEAHAAYAGAAAEAFGDFAKLA